MINLALTNDTKIGNSEQSERLRIYTSTRTISNICSYARKKENNLKNIWSKVTWYYLVPKSHRNSLANTYCIGADSQQPSSSIIKNNQVLSTSWRQHIFQNCVHVSLKIKGELLVSECNSYQWTTISNEKIDSIILKWLI
jgi:hypothetical protein